MICPSCGEIARDDQRECPACGVIFAKWRAVTRERPMPASPAFDTPKESGGLLRAIVIGVIVAAALIGGWWWVEIRPRLQSLDRTAAELPSPKRTNERPARAAGDATSEARSPEVEALLVKLRDDDWAARLQAENKLTELGVPISFDREQDSSPDLGPEDTDVLDWWAEIKDGEIVASWRIHFGDDLFDTESKATENPISMPLFARYEVSVEGGSLDEEIKRRFDAPHPGTVGMDDVVLASGLGPGEYQVNLFIHVQYIKPDGTPHVLNQSVIPLRVAQ